MTYSKQQVIKQKHKTQFIELMNKINKRKQEYINTVNRLYNELKTDLSVLDKELIIVENNIIRHIKKNRNNNTFYKENIPLEEIDDILL
jgi:hypothetical protein